MATSGTTTGATTPAAAPAEREAAPETTAPSTLAVEARTAEQPNTPERLACPVCGALALEVDKHAATHLAHGRNENKTDPDSVYNEFAGYETVSGSTWFCNACGAVIVDTSSSAAVRK